MSKIKNKLFILLLFSLFTSCKRSPCEDIWRENMELRQNLKEIRETCQFIYHKSNQINNENKILKKSKK